ncbi:hypothetical protein JTE90_027429 [Oedothorax gibbosus]|uniref:Uncharacterized protein n=1 Tax=Oedothorax gibbosus TaxID=931172 RepID=A0AAV6W4V8_9ARAC|nr:hypothetical protein JTE90_027429 [Oedothorax gibbosus]
MKKKSTTSIAPKNNDKIRKYLWAILIAKYPDISSHSVTSSAKICFSASSSHKSDADKDGILNRQPVAEDYSSRPRPEVKEHTSVILKKQFYTYESD